MFTLGFTKKTGATEKESKLKESELLQIQVLQLCGRSPRWSFLLCPSLSAQIAQAASARWTRWTLLDTRTTVTASQTKGSQVRRETRTSVARVDSDGRGEERRRWAKLSKNAPPLLPSPSAHLDAGAESVSVIFLACGARLTSHPLHRVARRASGQSLSSECRDQHGSEGTLRYTSPAPRHPLLEAKSVSVESLMAFHGGNVKKKTTG